MWGLSVYIAQRSTCNNQGSLFFSLVHGRRDMIEWCTPANSSDAFIIRHCRRVDRRHKKRGASNDLAQFSGIIKLFREPLSYYTRGGGDRTIHSSRELNIILLAWSIARRQLFASRDDWLIVISAAYITHFLPRSAFLFHYYIWRHSFLLGLWHHDAATTSSLIIYFPI